ncbi:MAG: hypothetical protein IJ644_09655 [Oscillospiraceae bacterium]|nr:hypothetical protein [Oscillospiraceae bacterium]
MNIDQDLKIIENAVTDFRRHDEVDAYRIVSPAERLLRQSCERMKKVEEAKARTCYDAELLPEIKKFVNALHQYTKEQDYSKLRTAMEQEQRALKDFNKSVDYLIRAGLMNQQEVIIIPQNPQSTGTPPARRKSSASPSPSATPAPVPVPVPVPASPPVPQASRPAKRRSAPAGKTLAEKYFSDTGNHTSMLNKNIELIIKITAEETENHSIVVQYYLANKNAFRRKESYKNLWHRILKKNKIISYQQAFRVLDWKPLFLEKNITEEMISLSRNIFGVPREGNLQDDGLLLKLHQDSLQISFKTYGERASKSLKSEFSGQTQQMIELPLKDFMEKNEKNTCHYQDTVSFYHQFNHVQSDWNQKEVLVNLKIDLKLK